MLNPAINTIPEHIANKHDTRKHGPAATYGQHDARTEKGKLA
ncbi:MAG: hypothetical protein OSB41_00785 [Kiritimatiellae bacterium]|nr:hypothetical protein [Kiritimatiellia bacterium]